MVPSIGHKYCPHLTQCCRLVLLNTAQLWISVITLVTMSVVHRQHQLSRIPRWFEHRLLFLHNMSKQCFYFGFTNGKIIWLFIFFSTYIWLGRIFSAVFAGIIRCSSEVIQCIHTLLSVAQRWVCLLGQQDVDKHDSICTNSIKKVCIIYCSKTQERKHWVKCVRIENENSNMNLDEKNNLSTLKTESRSREIKQVTNWSKMVAKINWNKT